MEIYLEKHIYKNSDKSAQTAQETKRERREWLKPIMFTGGLGIVSEDQIWIKRINQRNLVWLL